MSLELFTPTQVVGVFRGFQEGGMEFHADLVLPYRNEFQSLPMHGQFLLVQLETPQEAVLGRIASFSSEGKLSFGAGEEFNIRAVREGRHIPEDLREQYLKYKVNIRVLGVLRKRDEDALVFIASHRRLPHVGSPVAFPSGEVLREIVGHNGKGAQIGHYALGEYIYAQDSKDFEPLEWMQIKAPEVHVRFPIESLVARRTFILARAGFGKSNLNKLLFSQLYSSDPTVEKRRGKVPVGTLIFDPDGEYFWPDDKGRPGLCDVPDLETRLVVFTDREGPSPFYQSFVAGGIKIDIRNLKPSDVISIALSPERQDQQNVRKLKGLSQQKWSDLVNLLQKDGNQADLKLISKLVGLEDKQDMEALATRGNMTTIVRTLHDPTSQMLDLLLKSLSEGKLCVVDVSRMRGAQAMMLSGIILKRIFDHNQDEFIKAMPMTIPTVVVIEEAQSVLVGGSVSNEPFVAWVKEGRKYDLGAVLVTQQPGSLPMEILSQGDNWFLFHLLSATDLGNVRKANAHFSEDLLSALLNEPIPGQGVFWSSVSGTPYPVSVRVKSFEKRYSMRDPDYDQPAALTYAKQLTSSSQVVANGNGNGHVVREVQFAPTTDRQAELEELLANALQNNTSLMRQLKENGVSWENLRAFFKSKMPDYIFNPGDQAHKLIPPVLDRVFGLQEKGWQSCKPEGKNSTWVRVIEF